MYLRIMFEGCITELFDAGISAGMASIMGMVTWSALLSMLLSTDKTCSATQVYTCLCWLNENSKLDQAIDLV